MPPFISGSISDTGQVQYVDGIEGHAFQSAAHRHQVRQVLNIDVGGVLGEVALHLLVQSRLLGVVIGGERLLEQLVVFRIVIVDEVGAVRGGKTL